MSVREIAPRAFLFLAAFVQPLTAVADEPADRLLGEDPRLGELAPPPLPGTRGLILGTYDVRVVYFIPANRSAQPDAVRKLQNFVVLMQEFFADRMELMGYGPKTFEYETEGGGSKPLINVIRSTQPDTYFHGDYGERWSRVLTEISESGFYLFIPGDTTLVVAEMHIQQPDGSFLESSIFVGGAGSYFSGVGMVTGENLAKFSERFLTDNRPYHGLIIPGIGPYPLVQDVSFPWFEGSTLSSTTSSAYGATIHELSHGFGLGHDFRNDNNFNGNLLGNGLRGMRGALFPDLYPNDDTRLSSASALLLNYSRFFNADQTFTEESEPYVEILSGAKVTPDRGRCGIRITTSDQESKLAAAVLFRAGQVVGDKPLSGTTFSGPLLTYDYVPGRAEEWEVLVMDRQGNKTLASIPALTCAAGHNRAPYPFFTVSKTRIIIGENLRMDARSSFDPDGSDARLKVQWDVDGDRRFDTTRSTVRVHDTVYSEPGIYRIRARLTDEQGDSTVSMPIGIRVLADTLRVNIDIRPGYPKNVIDPTKEGRVRVAVLSDSEFDPLQVDIPTVRFGPDKAKVMRYEVSDVNGDGLSDVVLLFDVLKTGIPCGASNARLRGRTYLGQLVTGKDVVMTVGCQE